MDKPVLLCVDDEQFVLHALERLFRQDYRVRLATCGEEALKILAAETVHVIISDQRMPGMKGVDLLRAAKSQQPGAMRILLTGYADLNAIVGSVNEGEVFRYITKPWKNEVLRYTVHIAAQAAAASLQEIVNQPSGALTLELSSGSAQKDASVLTDMLVIDQDPDFRATVVAACGPAGRVLYASSMAGALDLLEKNPSIGVIVSEVRIKEEDITALLTTLKRYHPAVVTVVASGYQDASMVVKLINEGQIFRFLGKPTTAERLRLALRGATSMHRSIKQSTALVQRFAVEGESPATGASGPVLGAQPSVPAGAGGPGPQAAVIPDELPGGLIGRIKALFSSRSR